MNNNASNYAVLLHDSNGICMVVNMIFQRAINYEYSSWKMGNRCEKVPNWFVERRWSHWRMSPAYTSASMTASNLKVTEMNSRRLWRCSGDVDEVVDEVWRKLRARTNYWRWLSVQWKAPSIFNSANSEKKKIKCHCLFTWCLFPWRSLVAQKSYNGSRIPLRTRLLNYLY